MLANTLITVLIGSMIVSPAPAVPQTPVLSLAPVCSAATPRSDIGTDRARCAASLATALALRPARQASISAPPRPPRFPNECQELTEAIPMRVFTRLLACSMATHALQKVTVPGGQLLGTATVQVYEWTELNVNSKTWVQNIRIENIFATGVLVSGLTVKSGRHQCLLPGTTAECTRLSTPIPNFVSIPQGVPYTIGYSFTAGDLPGMAYMKTRSSFIYASPPAPEEPEISIPEFGFIRCDDRPEFSSPGCVHPDARLVLTYYTYGLPELTSHILAAQDTLIGAPGRWPNVGGPLFRLTPYWDPVLYAANQSRTLINARCVELYGPKPEGKDCDEYPFASTWQGGVGGDPGYPHNNFSVRYVDSAQNQTAGGQLGAFYTKWRVLDGYYEGCPPPLCRPLLDPFWVQIKNGRGI